MKKSRFWQARIRPVTILVALLDEGTNVWYPVEAKALGSDNYIITGINPDPDDLHWQFTTGTKVRCEQRIMADGQRELVAVEELSN
jgi:hypothetical protein